MAGDRETHKRGGAMGMEAGLPMTVHTSTGESGVVTMPSCPVAKRAANRRKRLRLLLGVETVLQSSPERVHGVESMGFGQRCPGTIGGIEVEEPTGILAPICMTSLAESLNRTSPQSGDEWPVIPAEVYLNIGFPDGKAFVSRRMTGLSYFEAPPL